MPINRLLRHKRGGTLVEVAISIFIISMLAVALFALLSGTLRGWTSGTSKERVVGATSLALQKIGNEIRDGRTAIADGELLAVTFPATVTDPDTHQQIYDLSASDPDMRFYFVYGGRLISYCNGSYTTLGRDIDEVQFGANGGAVTITLTSTENVGTVSEEREVTGRIMLRNYRAN